MSPASMVELSSSFFMKLGSFKGDRFEGFPTAGQSYRTKSAEAQPRKSPLMEMMLY